MDKLSFNKNSSKNKKNRRRHSSSSRRSNDKKESTVGGDDDVTMMDRKISSENAAAAAAKGGGMPAEVSFDSNSSVVDVNENNDDIDKDRNKFLVPAATAATTATSSAAKVEKGKSIINNKNKRSARALGDIDVNAITTTNGRDKKKKSSNSSPPILKPSPNEKSITTNGVLSTGTEALVAAKVDIKGDIDIDDSEIKDTATAIAAENKKEKERDWKSIQQELDELFVKQSNERMSGVPEIDMSEILLDNGVELYQHQIDGIRWLAHKESGQSGVPPYYKLRKYGRFAEYYRCTLSNKVFKGCNPPPLTNSILADDMGLGKTLQSIGLILANPPVGRNGEKVYPYRKPKGPADPRTTLIVGPVSVLANWKIEIDKFVNKKKSVLKVAIYAGKDRSEVLRKVQDGGVDIIICSYQTLSSDWRKKLEKEEEEKEKEKEDSKDDDEEMAVDDDSDDEDSGSGGSRRHPKRHIEKKSYANGGAGTKEDDDASDDNYDDESEFESDDDDDSDDEDWDADAQEEPCIFDLLFHRIILDEAHTIRNSKTAYFASTNAIEAVHKLCITGTPFVNHPRDIHSFLSFLNVSPLNDISTFNSVVVVPIEERKEIGLARLRVVMSALAIRRTKNEVKREISLKKKTVEIRKVDFPDNNPHKMCSDMLYHTCRNAFLALLQNGNQKFGRKVFLLFGLVLRVRQACASCDLVPKYFRDEIATIWDDMKDANVEAMTGEEGEALYDKIVKTLKVASEKACALKEKKRNGSIGSDDDDENGYDDDDDDSVIPLQEEEEEEEEVKFGRSPKIQALMDAISQMKEGEKGVIFSQWTKYLDIIAEELEYENHSFGHLNGKMDLESRALTMKSFAEDSGPRFLLCSLTACGTGITLTRANHVYMMDTWWNVAAENQAMDRVHRIGQKRDVRALRFIMKNSIEERFLNVQDAKQALGKGSLEKLKKNDRSKARITAMKDLFQMDCDNLKWEGVYDSDDDDDGADLKDFIVDDDVED